MPLSHPLQGWVYQLAQLETLIWKFNRGTSGAESLAWECNKPAAPELLDVEYLVPLRKLRCLELKGWALESEQKVFSSTLSGRSQMMALSVLLRRRM